MGKFFDSQLRFGIVFVSVFLGLIAVTSKSLAGEVEETPVDVDLKKILNDWKVRQASLSSVRYKVSGRGLISKGKFTGDPDLPRNLRGQTIPPEDHVFEMKLFWLIDFSNNRLRKEFKEEQFNSDVGIFVPLHRFYIYDGATTKRYIPKEDNQIPGRDWDQRSPELGLGSNGNTIDYLPSDYPIFLAQGIVGLTKILTRVPGPEKVRLPLDKLDIEVRGRRVFEGKECVVLRLFPKDTLVDELWIDTSRQSAIIRMDVYAMDMFHKLQLSTRIDIRYRESGDFPDAWNTTQFWGNGGAMQRSEKLQVDRFEINPEVNTEDFDIPLNPGMVVTTFDVKAGLANDYAKQNYRVASDGKTLEDLDTSSGRRWHLGMYALAIGFSALILGGWVLSRKLPRLFGGRTAGS